MPLPALPTIEEIQSRLEIVFPSGTQRRNSVVGERAARTVYVMLYIGAIEGSTTVLVPKHVYRMTAEQAELTSETDRLALLAASSKKGFQPAGTRWYSDNTREPIRDETLKDGLVKYNAVILDEAAVTTANVGRYQLRSSFAALFAPDLQGEALPVGNRRLAESTPVKGRPGKDGADPQGGGGLEGQGLGDAPEWHRSQHGPRHQFNHYKGGG